MCCAKKGVSLFFHFPAKTSLKIKKRLQNAIERTLPFCKTNINFKSPSTTLNRFHFKNVFIYYGKTKRYFYVRAAEHMEISYLTKKRLKIVNQSAT